MKILQKIRPFFNAILDALYPNQCICCGKILKSEKDLCDTCRENIEKIDAGKCCKRCGIEKASCECHFIVYHFVACVAPFRNEGLARKGFYRLKFLRKEHYADYFAKEMARMVQLQYKGVHFDGICYVPASIKSGLKRGFNQSRSLALKVSKILGVPCLKKTLKRCRSSMVQHGLNRDQRFANVQNLFYCVGPLEGKRILLVDDIKTTGATLDACARALLFGGAEEVYCVTALVTGTIRRKTVAKRKGISYNAIRTP